MRACSLLLTGLLLVACCCVAVQAADPPASELTPAQSKFFEEKIRPVLVNQCAECHARDARQIRGGLLVDSPAALREGGDSGPAIVPGNVEESLLISALQYESFEMPPRGKLSPEVIQDFVTWVKQGAFDPRPNDPVARPVRTIDLEAGRQFWAFQLPRPATIPEGPWSGAVTDDIDKLLLARHAEAGLAPVEAADRMTLLRRVTFDLVGLPPSPQEIDNFLRDDSPEAFPRVVDRLLASPRFGERWGRHWLDVARYADSTGGGRSALYDTAWYYRDYVIRAYNSDKPFDQFILEQLAGDLLPEGATLEEQRDRVQATAFLTLGPTNYELQDKKQLRMDVVDEQIDTTGRAFLAMTIGCARCHDHKFDPIPVTDYYALAGIFGSTQTLVDGNVSTWIKRELPLPPEELAALEQHQQELKQAQASLNEFESRIERMAAAQVEGLVLDDAAATFTGEWTGSTYTKGFVGVGYRHARQADATAVFETPLDPGLYEVRLSCSPGANRCTATPIVIDHAKGQQKLHINQREPGKLNGYVSLGTFEFSDSGRVTISGCEGSGVVIADAVQFVALNSGETDKDGRAALQAQLKQLQEERYQLENRLKQLQANAPAPPPELLSIEEAEQIADSPLYVRGNVHQPGDVVPRGFLSVAVIGERPELPADHSGRLELAQWIASPDNPLTARVYVNRVWAHLFGQGLVRTVDNFGLPGERPSHPELLDQLALDFIQEGWSSKSLIRRLVLTQAYQRAADGQVPANDPENRLLTRQSRRRLEAESLYDALLTLSGELQHELGGDPVRSGTSSEYGYKFEVGRRAVYLPMFRNQLPDLFAVFDFPNPNLSTGQRNVSTLSTQALFLLNSPFVQERSTQTAVHLLQEQPDPVDRLQQLYLQALSRPPSPTEVNRMQTYLESEMASGATELQAWSRAVQALVGSLDFRFH